MLRLAPVLLVVHAAAPKVEAPPLPAPPVTLRVETPTPAGPWKLVVENRSDATLRFAADGRLLRLEVKPPPGAEKVDAKPRPGRAPKEPALIECKLPGDLRPNAVDESRAVLLGPGARYEEEFSPALYCFGTREREALVPGAEVTAKLGWAPPPPPRRKLKDGVSPPPPPPPFIAEPTAIPATVAGVKELVAPTFILATAEPASASADAPSAPEAPPSPDPGAPKLEISGPVRVDAAGPLAITLPITVKNAGARPMTVHLRRDQLSFEVAGPTGTFRCGRTGANRTVARDTFGTLRGGERRTFDVLLGEVCEDRNFARPGLYQVTPSVATTQRGDAFRLSAFIGSATAKEPIVVRVRSAPRPYYAAPPKLTAKSTD